uniref:Glutamyl-tRNA(Gln) amidotransferase subunit B, mitochondrial n=1 Tax=Lygus hesperus TaxID=30085 RepID=A0A0A9YG45_LYGHE
MTALALNCRINSVSYFDRKHYFYADLPAGYQITQQRRPLAENGILEFQVFAPAKKRFYYKTSRLKQLQLEQDSGKSLHDDHLNRSLIDLNRAGVPLMELVFEPDLSDGEEAAALVKELILILTRLRTCSCRMEEGALRVDANISVNREGEALGVRTEVKNLGSIRGVANSIDFEINRQIQELEGGRIIENETRGWDAVSSQTVPMRDKEVKLDYRFMPEPNLPPLRVNLSSSESSLISVQELSASLPELPGETRNRLKETYGLSPEMINNLVNEDQLLSMFTAVLEAKTSRDPKIIAKILTIELMTLVNKELTSLSDVKWNVKTLGEITDFLQEDKINLTTAQFLLQEIANNNPNSPEEIVSKLGLAQISDPATLQELCSQIINDNPKMVKQYRSGKTKVISALLGAVAQKSGNRANMKLASQIMKDLLSS